MLLQILLVRFVRCGLTRRVISRHRWLIMWRFSVSTWVGQPGRSVGRAGLLVVVARVRSSGAASVQCSL